MAGPDWAICGPTAIQVAAPAAVALLSFGGYFPGGFQPSSDVYISRPCYTSRSRQVRLPLRGSIAMQVCPQCQSDRLSTTAPPPASLRTQK